MAEQGPYPMSMCQMSLYLDGKAIGVVFLLDDLKEAVEPELMVSTGGNFWICTAPLTSVCICFSRFDVLQYPTEQRRASCERTIFFGNDLLIACCGKGLGKAS